MAQAKFDAKKAEKLFAEGKAHLSKGDLPEDGFVVLAQASCSHCKATLRDTDYPKEVNGKPVTWINIDDTEAAVMVNSLPGFTPGEWVLNGKPIEGVPALLEMKDGKLTNIITTGAFGKDTLEKAAGGLTTDTKHKVDEAAKGLASCKNTGQAASDEPLLQALAKSKPSKGCALN